MTIDARINLPANSGKPLFKYIVKTPQAWLQRRASPKAAVETQLLYGQGFNGYKVQGRYVWGQAVTPLKGSKLKHYIGYMRLSELEKQTQPARYIIRAMRAPVFSQPDMKSRITTLLPRGALLRFSSKGRSPFRQLSTGGFVHENHFTNGCVSHKAEDFVSVAEQYSGLPYIWGGTTTDGVDCSGLVQSSLRAIGTDAPRDADQQELGLGQHLPVRLSGLKRGDLIFWRGHVGIMQSSTKMIHANAYHMTIASEPLSRARNRIAESGSGDITSIKRLTIG